MRTVADPGAKDGWIRGGGKGVGSDRGGGFSEARAERAALEADRMTSINEPPGVFWKEAFVVMPANWEYARKLAEAQVAEGFEGGAGDPGAVFVGVDESAGESRRAGDLGEGGEVRLRRNWNALGGDR
jgi:hypothetical protein